MQAQNIKLSFLGEAKPQHVKLLKVELNRLLKIGVLYRKKNSK